MNPHIMAFALVVLWGPSLIAKAQDNKACGLLTASEIPCCGLLFSRCSSHPLFTWTLLRLLGRMAHLGCFQNGKSIGVCCRYCL